MFEVWQKIKVHKSSKIHSYKHVMMRKCLRTFYLHPSPWPTSGTCPPRPLKGRKWDFSASLSWSSCACCPPRTARTAWFEPIEKDNQSLIRLIIRFIKVNYRNLFNLLYLLLLIYSPYYYELLDLCLIIYIYNYIKHMFITQGMINSSNSQQLQLHVSMYYFI